TYLFAAVLVSTTLPTPLYAIYAQRLSLKPFMITIIFATYAVGVLAALLLFGRLADLAGRKPVLIAAVAVSAISGVVFIATSNLAGLFAGRFLSGISAGLVTGAATAYISELYGDRARGGLLATIANMGGLGLGPLIAGPLAEHAPDPTRLPYAVGIALLVPALLVLVVPDTVARAPGGIRAGLRPQRLGIPHDMRVAFAAAAIAGFVGFALLGFFTSLVGSFLAQGLSDHSHQTAGIVPFLVFAAGTAGQVVAGRWSTRPALLIGLAAVPIGLVLITTALPAGSLSLFVSGGIVGGAAVGVAFRAAVVSIAASAPDERRGEVLSTFFVIAYVGLTVPVIGAGVLISSTTLFIATLSLAIFIAALAAVAAAILIRLPASA
ncbi:MAG: MFS transporter, partial [Acidothermaceae bacterium]